VISRRLAIARASRGPVILITIGTLFAIHQAGGFPFERTWPFLIIVLGLMKLIERIFTQQMPVSAPPYPQAPNQPPYPQPPFTQPPFPPPPAGGPPR
jgi:hypothetical protein